MDGRHNLLCPYGNAFALDARHLETGIGAYTRNLIRSLYALRFRHVHALTKPEHMSELQPYCRRVSVIDAPIYSVREQITVPWAARRDTLLHVPHYNAPLLYRGTLLATIHDLTHLLDANHRGTWKTRFYASPMLHAVTKRAAHLFTVSEYSKKQMVKYLGVPPEKITVVYNGIGAQFVPGDQGQARDAVARRFGILRPYLLYVGSLKPHKNIETLLDAYAGLEAGKMRGVDLVIVGTGLAGRIRLEQQSARLGLDPTFVSDADDLELADLYRAAEVLILPSFEEGFGLPILEAMACGTAVVCANAAAMPEVAGNAAMLFDPYDPQDLSRILRRVLSENELKQSLRERGLIRAQQFSWAKTAAHHIPVYRKYLSQPETTIESQRDSSTNPGHRLAISGDDRKTASLRLSGIIDHERAFGRRC
jgi:glycosyltransferase involved in cell wall biosynthesis